MTKNEYNAYIEALEGQDYQFWGSWYNRPYYSKVIEYRDNEDGDNIAVCQLVFNIYSREYKCSGDVYYSIVPVVVVSRNTEERLDLTISQPKQRSIEECERIAKEFMRWVDMNIKEIKDDD